MCRHLHLQSDILALSHVPAAATFPGNILRLACRGQYMWSDRKVLIAWPAVLWIFKYQVNNEQHVRRHTRGRFCTCLYIGWKESIVIEPSPRYETEFTLCTNQFKSTIFYLWYCCKNSARTSSTFPYSLEIKYGSGLETSLAVNSLIAVTNDQLALYTSTRFCMK